MRRIVLMLVLALSGMTWAIGGNMGNGDGSEGNPYLIEDVNDFDAFAGNSAYWADGVHTKLKTDIDLSGRIYTTAVISPDTNTGSGFQGTQFRGIFNGNRHIIKNLTIIDSDDYTGLFGYIYEGQIKDTILENANIQGQVYVGGLVGYKVRGTIAYCQVEGFISGYRLVGGVAGYGSGIYNSCSFGSVNGNYEVGGLIGHFSDLVIKNCYSTSAVSGINQIGGLIGKKYFGSLQNCYSTGAVTGTGYDIGGLVGYSYGGTTRNCFWDIISSGQTTSDAGLGKTTSEMKEIQTFLDAGWGFIDGRSTNENWVLPDNDYPKLAWEIYTKVTIPNLKGETQSQAIDILNTINLQTEKIFSVYDASVQPGLISETFPKSGEIIYAELTPVHLLLAKENKYAGGNGDTIPYMISELDNWFEMMNSPSDWGLSFVLLNNLDFEEITFTQSCIAPSSQENYFSGTKFDGLFDGNNHVISNLSIATSGRDYIGLFGYVDYGGQIKNLAIDSSTIQGRYNVGGITGVNNGEILFCSYNGSVIGNQYIGMIAGINSRFIGNSDSNGSSRGNQYIGGIAGDNTGTISSCHNIGELIGTEYIGGLCGINHGTISKSYTNGTISASGFYVGGLIGRNDDYSSSVTKCYSTNSVSGTSYVGGLIGYDMYGNITDCNSIGPIDGVSNIGGLCGYSSYSIINQSFSSSEVMATGDNIGGLVGYNNGATITNCSASGDVEGNSNIGGYVGIPIITLRILVLQVQFQVFHMLVD